MRSAGKSEKDVASLAAQYPPVEHPVVRTHPQTGRKALYVNAAFTQHIVGMDEDESDALLKQLYAQARVPEYQCRFRWRSDSIAFWDNRCTQHYAVSDDWPAVRRMERATIVGDRPR
jgi:taurine dioxygenase